MVAVASVSADPFPGRSGPGDIGRFLLLLDNATDDIQETFLRLIGQARGVRTLEEIADLITAGRITEALDMMEEVGPSFVNAFEAAYLAAGLSTANLIRNRVATLIDFNQLNIRSINALQRERLRLVQNLTIGQRQASLLAIQDGLAQGVSSTVIARRLKSSIGLSTRQVQASRNFRRLLETNNLRTLQFRLRDRRFDATIRRAAREGIVLTQTQIDRMVLRYEERALRRRSLDIARSEALRAVNMADEEMWQQAVEAGVVDPDQLVSIWFTASDERVRTSHALMHEQERPFNEPFLSGNGNLLMFPGDPSAPGNDTINCRCVRARDLPPRAL